jgi:hypothetical protein
LDGLDLDWLSARLDTFAKFSLYSAVLREEGVRWSDLPQRPELFSQLALLDHSYHEFCSPRSVFHRLEAAGLLQHRVGPRVEAGGEGDPFVPETDTRARARARFIRQNAGSRFLVDWSWIIDNESGTCQQLHDVFAQNLGPAVAGAR